MSFEDVRPGGASSRPAQTPGVLKRDGGSGGGGSPHSALLIVLVFLTHAPALCAYFEADDFLWVIHQSRHDALSALTGSWGLGTAYRPVTRLSFLLDARLFGWTAWPWHAVNLGLHAANAIVLTGVARQAGVQQRDAFLAAALFAVLPVDWENVDWISGRTGLLCLLFLLCTVRFWLRFLQGSQGLAASCCFLALAMLAYEPACVLPLGLLLSSLVLRWEGRRLVVSLAALAGTASFVWLLRWAVLGTAGVATDVAAPHYWTNLAWDSVRMAAHAWRDFGTLGFVGVIGALASGLAARRTRRIVLSLLVAALALVLPFTPVAGFTERFLYLASAPLAAALIAAVAVRPWGRPACMLLIALCAWRSHAQADGFRHAGDLTRLMLSHIKAIPADGDNLVFDGVPTHDGRYYLLWANFEDAVAALRPARGFAATTEWVLRNRDLCTRALTEPTHFLVYDNAGGFIDETRAAWAARNGVARRWP